MTLQIKRLGDVVKPEQPKVVVWGASGAGKTRLIHTLPAEPSEVLIVSAEGGLLSLRDFPEYPVAEVSTVDDLREVYRAAASGAYKWVALDSLSEIAEVILATAKGKVADPRQAYGALIDDMLKICRSFRALPCGVYLTAKEEQSKDEATGRIRDVLSMPGSKLAQQIPYLFDEVFRLVVVEDKDTKEVSRWLQTQSDSKVTAKDRSGALDPYEPADLGAIVNKIAGTFPAEEK